jgi:hypothetical protein
MAFYGIDSKDDLVAMRGRRPTPGATHRWTSSPLVGPASSSSSAGISPEHRDAPADGCPSAALLDEIAAAAALSGSGWASKGLLALADEVAARLTPDDPASARATVLGAFATLIGTLQLARAVTDPSIADAILKQGAMQAIAALGLEQKGHGRVSGGRRRSASVGAASPGRAEDGRRRGDKLWSIAVAGAKVAGSEDLLAPAFTTRPVALNLSPTAGAR